MNANTTTFPDTKEFETFFEKQNLKIAGNNKKAYDLKTEIENSISNFKIASFQFENTPVVFSESCMEHHFNQIFHQTQRTNFLITEISLWYRESINSEFHTTSCFNIEYKFNEEEMIKMTGFALCFISESLQFGENNTEVDFEFNFKDKNQYDNFIKKINIFREIFKQFLF